jgi:hypothetical protein
MNDDPLLPVDQGVPVVQEVHTRDSIEELFSRDPNGWSKDDVDEIVRTLRSKRASFVQEEAAKQVAAKKPKAEKAAASTGADSKAAKPKPALGGLSLDSLNLKLPGMEPNS